MSHPHHLMDCFFLLIAGGFLLWLTFQRRKYKSLVEDTPTSKLATASQGQDEFQGFAWPKGDGFVGYGDKSYVHYDFKLQREETRGSGKNRRREWVTKAKFTFNESFYLLDPTGLALIHPRKSRLQVSNRRTRLWRSIASAERKFFLQRLISGSICGFPPGKFLGGLFSGKFRVVESAITCGSPLYVNGEFRTLSRDTPVVVDPALADFARKVIKFDSRRVKNVDRILDSNGDGKVTEVESRRGYTVAAQSSRLKGRVAAGEAPAADHEVFEVLGEMHATDDHILLIADTHEKYLVRDLGRFQFLGLAGGALLIIAGLLGIIMGLNGHSRYTGRTPASATRGK